MLPPIHNIWADEVMRRYQENLVLTALCRPAVPPPTKWARLRNRIRWHLYYKWLWLWHDFQDWREERRWN